MASTLEMDPTQRHTQIEARLAILKKEGLKTSDDAVFELLKTIDSRYTDKQKAQCKLFRLLLDIHTDTYEEMEFDFPGGEMEDFILNHPLI